MPATVAGSRPAGRFACFPAGGQREVRGVSDSTRVSFSGLRT